MATGTRFTETAIAKIKPPASGRVEYRDAKIPNLVLRVSQTGRMVWTFIGRMDGRPTRHVLGPYPALTVAEAKKKALGVMGQLANGENPAASKRKVREESTFGELWERYLEGYAKARKKSWREDERIHKQFLEPWKARRLSTITRGDVASLHSKAGRDSGHYMANRLLALVSKVFSYAQEQGFGGANPAHGIQRFKEQSRDRFMDPTEIKAFFQALANEPDTDWRDFFTLSLLTGARRANVLAMRWDDMDLKRGLWRIPETEAKGGEPLMCILAPSVVEILKRRQAEAKKVSDWVFPADSKTGHVQEPKKAWAKLLERAGISDLRIHDLRRTLGSWAAISGFSLPIIGKVLGHKNVATTAIYARLDMDPARHAVETATTAILEAAKPEEKEPKQLPAPKEEGEGTGEDGEK